VIRRAFYEVCGRSGLPRLFLWGIRRLPPLRLPVLAYHRVAEPDPGSPWDPDLISATPDVFRRQLDFVSRHFTPVRSEAVVAWAENGKAMPKSPIVITFDDGYRDNRTVALPILQEAGLVADFFICPWYITNRRLFWWDKMAYCVRRSDGPALSLSYPRRLELPLGDPDEREAARRRLLHVAKRTPRLDFDRMLAELQAAAGVELNEPAAARELLMTWDDVRELAVAGMGVGSHSMSHRLLAMSDAATVAKELTRSRRAIEHETGRPVRTLAYPVGSFDDRTQALAREAGYRLAYAYSGGISRLKVSNRMALKRLAVERFVTMPYFRALLAFPFFN